MNPTSFRSVFLALALAVQFALGMLVLVAGHDDGGLPKVGADDATSSLSVELNIYWKGIKRPAAKMKIVLLDADPEIIMRDAGLEATPGADLTDTYAFASAKSTSPRLKKFREDADKAMKPHIIATGITDDKGKLRFAELKPGLIYLLGMAKIDRGRSLFRSPVELKRGANTLIT